METDDMIYLTYPISSQIGTVYLSGNFIAAMITFFNVLLQY